MASITHCPHGYVLSHVEGPDMPLLNGHPTGPQPVPLKSGDRLELAGTVMQFVQMDGLGQPVLFERGSASAAL